MAEKAFVDALFRTIQKLSSGECCTWRPADSYTMGLPDVMGIIKNYSTPNPWSIAIEAKELKPLMEDPFHKGRRTGRMLKHPFTGPQVSFLREFKEAGGDAFGLVRASSDIAFRLEPEDIPPETGNFAHEELVRLGRPVYREKGLWRFWGP